MSVIKGVLRPKITTQLLSENAKIYSFEMLCDECDNNFFCLFGYNNKSSPLVKSLISL